ncbi:Na /H antiporter [Ceraceosorus bombacis]|uniref:Na /H antiporter n=1 Tax=Ceraceosorus bombacis TaxID=401625 RepID=A0A0P1BAK7_9BASI|nr:Na /H antiporter [Ceraceosorus bombacis]
MGFELEVTPLNVISTSFGAFVLLYGIVSHRIKERFYLGEAPFALFFGILLAQYGVPEYLRGSPGQSADPLDGFGLGFSRFIIGTQLVLVGIELPYKYIVIEMGSLAMLLLPVMTTMWMVTSVSIWAVIPGVSPLVALAVASCATPTDPVLSNAIVKGSFAEAYVSPRIRNLISAESGANDGFGLPFTFLALNLIQKASTAEALKSWALEVVLWSVVGSVVWGAVVGFTANYLLKVATRYSLIDKESFLLFGVAMGTFVVGSGGLLGVDDLLACFIAGNALTWDDWYRRETEDDDLQNIVDLLCNAVFFTFIGVTIDWSSFDDPDLGITPARLILLNVLVLLLRRLPAMLLHQPFIPQIIDQGEAAFMGWFGPIGAGAVFYAFLVLDAIEEGDLVPDAVRIRSIIKPIIYSLVLGSVLGHTLLIPVIKLVFTKFGVKSIKSTAVADDASIVGSQTSSRLQEERYEAGEGHAPHDEAAERRDRRMSESQRRHSIMSAISGQPADMIGGYDADGNWVEGERASWRISSGHKLGPHTRMRNPQGGEVRIGDFKPSAWHRGEEERQRVEGLQDEATYGALEEGR